MSSADHSDASTSNSPVSDYDEYYVVPRRRTLRNKSKHRNSIRKTASNNETIKKLLIFVLVLLSSFFEIAMVNPLVLNTRLLFFGKDEISEANIIPVITEEHREQIQEHKKVYNKILDDFKNAQEGVNVYIDTNKVIDILSDTLPSFSEDNMGDMLFNDIVKDGNFDYDDLPDTRADLFKQHMQKITSTIVPVSSALGRLDVLNSNTTSFVKDNIDKTKLMAPFIGNIIFLNNEFPIDSGKKLFNDLKVLTDETITLLGSIFTSMIHVYQTHMYFYSGAVTHVLQCILHLQADNPLLIEPLLNEAKELMPDKNNLSGMFTVTTATNEPPIKLQDAVNILTEISSSAVVPYTGDRNTKTSAKSDRDIINNMLKVLQKTNDKFKKVSSEKVNINEYAKKLQVKVTEISETLMNLIELFDSKKIEEEKLEKNVNAFLNYNPLISIETSSRGSIKLLFSDFYKFLLQQILYTISMMSFLKTFDLKRRKTSFPFPVGTSIVLFPWLKKFLRLNKTRRTRRGTKKNKKSTRGKKNK